MCDTCGCGDPEIVPLDVQDDILAGNRQRAQHNRDHFRGHGVFTVNLMGSPGAGKTAVLEATARRLGAHARCGALAGDLATDRDAARLTRAGVPALSITTGSACHLDARMVHDALHQFPDWSALHYLFIENVGNLVCPAVYDLGQDVNVVALSVTEGEDKPVKYPVMFRKADLVLLTKIDLLPHLPHMDVDAVLQGIAQVMPANKVILFSAETGLGVDEWVDWLAERRASVRHDEAAHHAHHDHQHGEPHHHEHPHGHGQPRDHADDHQHEHGHHHQHEHRHA
jgi:hydrogenase nickel incorporation protein HypB